MSLNELPRMEHTQHPDQETEHQQHLRAHPMAPARLSLRPPRYRELAFHWTSDSYKYRHIGCSLLNLPPLSRHKVFKVDPYCWVWLWVIHSHWCVLSRCVDIPVYSSLLPLIGIWGVNSSELPWLTLLYIFPYRSFGEHILRSGMVGDQICLCSGLCRYC